MTTEVFAPWLELWSLSADGAPFKTDYSGSWLMPVRRAGQVAMLKIATEPEEVRGAALMAWWGGQGAAQVLALDKEALLLERAISPDGLGALSRQGHDYGAVERICAVVATIHEPRAKPPPTNLVPLRTWFAVLGQMSGQDARLGHAHAIAERLLAAPVDPVVLHGDIHHENILDFGPRGWLAIDPKGLIGERAYEYANSLRNPDPATALTPGRMAARLTQTASLAGLDPERLLLWVAAHSGLSAAWAIEDDRDPAWSLAVLEAALSLAAEPA